MPIFKKKIENYRNQNKIIKKQKIGFQQNSIWKTNNLAKKAALKVKIDLKISKPIVSIEEALKKKSFVLK